MFQLMSAHPAFVRIVAHALLNGHGPEELLTRTGGMSRIAALLCEEDHDQEEAQLLAAATASFVMGWLMFESFMLFGVGYEGDVNQAREFIAGKIRAMLAR